MYTSIHSHVRVHTNLGDALSSSRLQKQSAVHSLKRAIGAITSTRAQDCRYVVPRVQWMEEACVSRFE